MTRESVVVWITSQRFDFWLNMAARLNEDHDVVVVCLAETAAEVRRRIPGGYTHLETYFQYSVEGEHAPGDVVAEALRVEQTYGLRLSMVLSTFRDFGKGYIFNADRHPDMSSASWSHERKLEQMVHLFRFWEGVMARYKPRFILQEANSTIPHTVAKHRGIPSLALGFAKFGARYMWSENVYYQNSGYQEDVKRYVVEYLDGRELPELPDYELDNAVQYLDSKIDNGYRRALRDAVKESYYQTRHRVKRGLMRLMGRSLPPKYGYRYLGWVPPILRRPAAFRYMDRHGKTLKDLEGYKLVYVPMHLEPELALMCVSPEFNNTMEMVTWLSKSLPADYKIVLKENIVALGIRSRRYYEQLRRIGNVEFAHLSETSWDWIRHSEFTTTITGTAAVEAIYFKKSVLSFGRHQVVNLLPSVRFANDYLSTRRAVDEIIGMAGDKHLMDVSLVALNRAQIERSFELPGGEHLYDKNTKVEAYVDLAMGSLRESYPHLFDDCARNFVRTDC